MKKLNWWIVGSPVAIFAMFWTLVWLKVDATAFVKSVWNGFWNTIQDFARMLIQWLLVALEYILKLIGFSFIDFFALVFGLALFVGVFAFGAWLFGRVWFIPFKATVWKFSAMVLAVALSLWSAASGFTFFGTLSVVTASAVPLVLAFAAVSKDFAAWANDEWQALQKKRRAMPPVAPGGPPRPH